MPSIRFLCISDLHYMYDSDWESLGEAISWNLDAIILLGDIPAKEAAIIKKGAGSHIPVMYVLGNHDIWKQYDGIEGLIPLDGCTYRHMGITFTGMSGGPRYNNNPQRVFRTQEEASDIMHHLPGADVLITHESPYRLISKNPAHEGFKGITNYITEHKPVLHIFGHQHTAFEGRLEDTTELCIFRCALVDICPFKVTPVF